MGLLHVLSAATPATPDGDAEDLRKSRCRTVWVRYPEPSRKKILQPSSLQAPNHECLVCGSKMARVSLKGLADLKICAFVKSCVQGALGAHRPAVYFNNTCIFDPEYPEASEEAEEEGLHPEWTLQEWGLSSGSLIAVEDEGQGFSCNLIVTEDPDLSEEDHPSGVRIDTAPPPEPEAPPPEEASLKRSAD